jgi:hypothetical protein
MITTTTKETLKQAKQELNKIFDYIKENNDALTGYTDLKLHDASFYCYRDMQNDFPLCYATYSHNDDFYDYFYRFCESSFDQFTEDLNEKRIDFEKTIDRIGHTSKFYCYAGHDENAETMINDFIYSEYGDEYEIKNGAFSFSHYYGVSEIINGLEYFVKNAFNDFKAKTADAITIYKYIEDFKQNQIEYFKEYLTFYEDDLKAEKDAETAQYNADAETARNIADAYKIPAETMQTLKSVIYAY